MEWFALLFGHELCWWQWGIVAKSVKLAYASLPRLGEINKDSPVYFSTKGRLGDPLYFLGERTSCLGEEDLA